MEVQSTWTIKNPEMVSMVVYCNEQQSVKYVHSIRKSHNRDDSYIILEKEQSSDPCELTSCHHESKSLLVNLEHALELSGVQWIGSARICEVYIQEHGKTKKSYIGTVRCTSIERVVTENYPLFYGKAVLGQITTVSTVTIRFLSMKGKTTAIVNGLCIVGKETSIPIVKEKPSSKLNLDLQQLSSTISGELTKNLLFQSELRRLSSSIETYLDSIVSPLVEQNQELTKRVVELENQVAQLQSKQP